MAIGELRALPVGRGQIGKVKYIPVGLQGRGGRGIPSSVIKTGVKLPQMETVQQKEKPSMSILREELEQVAPTISLNPFLKNDQKRLSKMKSLLPSFRALKEREASDESEVEEVLNEREHSLQRDYLKQELDQVLKGIKKMGSEEDDEDSSDNSEGEDDHGNTDDMEMENEKNEESKFSERSSSVASQESDITLAFEDKENNNEDIENDTDNEDNPEDISDNTLEEMSAL